MQCNILFSVVIKDLELSTVYNLRLMLADINTFLPEEAAAHRDEAGAAAARWRGPEL